MEKIKKYTVDDNDDTDKKYKEAAKIEDNSRRKRRLHAERMYQSTIEEELAKALKEKICRKKIRTRRCRK